MNVNLACERFVPPLVREHLKEAEYSFLFSYFDRYQGYPSLQQFWKLMDEEWKDHFAIPTDG